MVCGIIHYSMVKFAKSCISHLIQIHIYLNKITLKSAKKTISKNIPKKLVYIII